MTVVSTELSLKNTILNKTIRIRVLSNAQLTEVFEQGVDIDFGEEEKKDGFDPFVSLMDACGSEPDFLAFSTLFRVFETLSYTIKNFQKLLPDIMSLNDEDFKSVIHDLYRTSILLNPVLDPETARILTGVEPLGEELERAAELLPELNPVVAAHLGRLQSMASTGAVEMMFKPQSFDDDGPMSIEDLLNMEVPGVKGMRLYDSNGEIVAGTPEAAQETSFELDTERIRELRTSLAERVVGQTSAIESIYSALKRAAVGFRDENRPISVLMFAGPTGVGKTLLSKETAAQLFGDKAFGRIDCAGLSKEYDVSKLLGPAPGYLGYPDVRPPMDPLEMADWDEEKERQKKDPSILWKAVKNMGGGGIFVIDEIEKAHPTIQDQFLTIFDEGYITTSVGNRVDFTKILIILTSNLGSRIMDTEKRRNPLGFNSACATVDDTETTMNADYVKKTATEAAKQYFKPEIMGRINHIVPFTDLSHEDLLKVVELEWQQSLQYLTKKIFCTIELDDSLRDRIATASKDAGYGARLISRLIEVFVNDPLAEMYIDEDAVLNNAALTVVVKWLGDECDHESIEISCEKAPVSRHFDIPKTVIRSN